MIYTLAVFSIWVVACSDPGDDAREQQPLESKTVDVEIQERPDESVALSTETERPNASPEDTVEKLEGELQKKLEDYDSEIKFFEDDTRHYDRLPALIQQMKDDLKAAKEEKARLENEISTFRKAQE